VTAGLPEPGFDLSDQVAVFVRTVGYPTFERCLEHVYAQDCRFRLEVIRNVAPISAAEQRMLDLCQTPFFVQVDEDMLLLPHAVRTLCDRIVGAGERVVQHVAGLWDVHLDHPIYGLKIFRHEVVRRYPYREVEGCEWDQIRRFRADDWVDVRVPIVGVGRDSPYILGLHGTYWTPLRAYIRFNVLERTRRKGNRSHDWLVEQAGPLIERYLRKGADIDFYALMGLLSGALVERLTEGRERDYRAYDRTPGFHTLQESVDEVRSGGRSDQVACIRPDIGALSQWKRSTFESLPESVVQDATKLIRRFLDHRSEADFCALIGLMSGVLSGHPMTGGEHRLCEDTTPGYRTLKRFVEEVRAGWNEGREIDPTDAEIDLMR
jgi:hypothetical protein